MSAGTTLEERVMAVLDTVQDPCSIATRHPLSIVELGLLVSLDVDEAAGDVRIVLRMTSGSCSLIGSIMQATEEHVGALEDVRRLRVELDGRSAWSPERMTETGARRLAAHRERTIRELGVRPHAERLAERAAVGVAAAGG